MPAGLILAGAQLGFSILGSYSKSRAQARAARFNAKIAERNAVLTRQQSAEQEMRFRRTSRRRRGARSAARGASGITATGSVLEAMADAAAEEELDALTIKYQGEQQAKSFEMQAQQYRQEAESASKFLGIF